MRYREELDKVRLTEAGKAALTQALCRRAAAPAQARPRRLARPWITAAAVLFEYLFRLAGRRRRRV